LYLCKQNEYLLYEYRCRACARLCEGFERRKLVDAKPHLSGLASRTVLGVSEDYCGNHLGCDEPLGMSTVL